MQVYRLHSTETLAKPATERALAGGPAMASQGANGATESASAEQGSGVGALLAQLRQHPEIREAVVEQARAKVANGDYLTRSSAEATAESLLSHES